MAALCFLVSKLAKIVAVGSCVSEGKADPLASREGRPESLSDVI